MQITKRLKKKKYLSSHFDCALHLCLNAYKILMHPDDINESLSFRQEKILDISYSVAYICISNNSLPHPIHSGTDDNNEISSINFTVLHQDTKLEYTDDKNCKGKFSYNSESGKLCCYQNYLKKVWW